MIYVKQAKYFKGTLQEFVKEYNTMQVVNASQLFPILTTEGGPTDKYEGVMYYQTDITKPQNKRDVKEVLSHAEGNMYDSQDQEKDKMDVIL